MFKENNSGKIGKQINSNQCNKKATNFLFKSQIALNQKISQNEQKHCKQQTTIQTKVTKIHKNQKKANIEMITIEIETATNRNSDWKTAAQYENSD